MSGVPLRAPCKASREPSSQDRNSVSFFFFLMQRFCFGLKASFYRKLSIFWRAFTIAGTLWNVLYHVERLQEMLYLLLSFLERYYVLLVVLHHK